MEEDRLLLVCGDIHGVLKTLVYNIKEQRKLSHVDVIVAGDFGVGFEVQIVWILFMLMFFPLPGGKGY